MHVSSRSIRFASLPLIVGTGCFGPGPSLSPAAIGCYAVESSAYGSTHAAITGFDALPEIIALDTAYRGRVLVPKAWRTADPRHMPSAGLSLYSYPWKVVGDTIMFDHRSRTHELGADSVIVTLRGWGGAMTMFLARDEDGFSGLAGFEPRMRPEDARAIPVRLRRAACPNDLV